MFASDNKTCRILDNIRGKLQEVLGVRVIRAGIGNKVYSYKHFFPKNRLNLACTRDITISTSHKRIFLQAKLPATLEVARENEMSSSLFGALVAAGVAATIAAAVVTLIIARRHAKCRAKLAGLTTPDPEASKDYQDLCRARMQAKQPSEKVESPRITSLSRESESNNLPSNRSSTSSWGEEPTLSNMDISTGHMVLVSIKIN